MDVCVRVLCACVCVRLQVWSGAQQLLAAMSPRRVPFTDFPLFLKLAGTTGSLFSYLTLRIHPYPHLHSDGR